MIERKSRKYLEVEAFDIVAVSAAIKYSFIVSILFFFCVRELLHSLRGCFTIENQRNSKNGVLITASAAVASHFYNFTSVNFPPVYFVFIFFPLCCLWCSHILSTIRSFLIFQLQYSSVCHLFIESLRLAFSMQILIMPKTIFVFMISVQIFFVVLFKQSILLFASSPFYHFSLTHPHDFSFSFYSFICLLPNILFTISICWMFIFRTEHTIENVIISYSHSCSCILFIPFFCHRFRHQAKTSTNFMNFQWKYWNLFVSLSLFDSWLTCVQCRLQFIIYISFFLCFFFYCTRTFLLKWAQTNSL